MKHIERALLFAAALLLVIMFSFSMRDTQTDIERKEFLAEAEKNSGLDNTADDGTWNNTTKKVSFQKESYTEPTLEDVLTLVIGQNVFTYPFSIEELMARYDFAPTYQSTDLEYSRDLPAFAKDTDTVSREQFLYPGTYDSYTFQLGRAIINERASTYQRLYTVSDKDGNLLSIELGKMCSYSTCIFLAGERIVNDDYSDVTYINKDLLFKVNKPVTELPKDAEGNPIGNLRYRFDLDDETTVVFDAVNLGIYFFRGEMKELLDSVRWTGNLNDPPASFYITEEES